MTTYPRFDGDQLLGHFGNALDGQFWVWEECDKNSTSYEIQQEHIFIGGCSSYLTKNTCKDSNIKIQYDIRVFWSRPSIIYICTL